MDSFGFDFAGGDLLDLGSLGTWGTTPLDSSPSNGNLPFSVGTPTGVQSLGGESGFTTLPVGDDFGFMDSPKALSNPSLSTSVPSSTNITSSTSTTTSQTTKSEDFFSSSLDQDTPTKTSESQETQPKSEEQPVKDGNTDNATSTTSGEDTSGLGSFMNGPSPGSSTGNEMNLSNAFQTKTSQDTSNASSKPSTTSSTTTTHPSTNASSARPHIDSTASTGPQSLSGPPGMPPSTHPSSQLQQLQPQPRYGGNLGQPTMMMGGPPPPTGYGMGMNVGPGQPMMNGQPQYMQPPPQQYRPTTSTYDEEMMRVKSMMMQHPDLIPPPLEVLRISMSQGGQGMPGMIGGASGNPNAYLQAQRPNPMVNRIGTGPGYAPYGGPNPNMMMTGQSGQSPMMDPRMRVMQQQMSQPRTSMSPQGRAPGGGPEGIPVAWQSESDLPLRRKMIGKIVSLLQQRKPDAPAEWIRRLPDMARRLEDSLYRTAKNRDEYGDFTSLKTRLQHLAVTMGARAQHKSGVTNPRPGAPPGAGGPGPGPSMMGPGGVPGAGGMGMNVGMPSGMPQGVAPIGMGVNGMPYGNAPNRMTPQQAQMLQQQQMQMQMQTRQFSPQQMQQYQAAQRHRHFQMQQQAQIQRQNSSQQFQQHQQAAAAAGLQRQNSIQRQHSGGQSGQQPPTQQQQMQMQQQMHQQMQQRSQNPNFMQSMQGVPGSNQGQQQSGAQAQLQRRNSMNASNPTAPTNANSNANATANANAKANANANANTNATRRPNTEMSGGLDGNDFLDLDLTQTFMGNDLDSTLNSNDLSGSDPPNSTGMKRTQQQMAAEANAAAFKRMKGSGPNPNQRGTSPHSPQKPGGQSKTPSMSTVNAK